MTLGGNKTPRFRFGSP